MASILLKSIKTEFFLYRLGGYRSWWSKLFLLMFCFLGMYAGTLQNATAQSTILFWQEAQSLFKQGRTLAIQKKYEHALIKYVAAVNLLKRAEKQETKAKTKKRYHNTRITMLYVIGRTYQLARQPARAYKAYDQCLRAKPNPKLTKIVLHFRKQVLSSVSSSIRIDSTPSGATLFLKTPRGQGRMLTTPFSGKLPPGTFVLRLSAPKYQALQTKLIIKAKTKVVRIFRLQRLTVPTKPKSKTSPLTIAMWVGVGVGVVTAGTGVILLLNGIAQEQSGLNCLGNVNDPACQTKGSDVISSEIKGGAGRKGVGVTFLVVAGLAGISAVVFGIMNKRKSTEKVSHQQSSSLSPMLPQKVLYKSSQIFTLTTQ